MQLRLPSSFKRIIGGSEPAPHTLVLPVPVRWQPVPRDAPTALQIAALVPEPSLQTVAAHTNAWRLKYAGKSSRLHHSSVTVNVLKAT